ncbi:MAG: hypothetical protein Q8R00_00920 [Candidatus Nanoarchaeia archaeon]|nr:hypothetical protein [Candidatus Nanoarchaeia archaeon]
MKTIVFDSGPVISLAMNNLLWTLPELKKRFLGEFLFSKDVRKELVDRPLNTKKFKFEALQILNLIEHGTLKEHKGDLSKKTRILMELANNMFYAKGRPLTLVQEAEMESLALAVDIGAQAYVVDERTTRQMIENPQKLAKLLSRKLKTDVAYNGKAYRDFQKEIGKIEVLRSVDLMVIAYELGILDVYLYDPKLKKELLEGIIWGLKLSGCSISFEEINDIMKLEGLK